MAGGKGVHIRCFFPKFSHRSDPVHSCGGVAPSGTTYSRNAKLELTASESELRNFCSRVDGE